MESKKVVYIAGPYRSATVSGMFENIMRARQIAIQLLQQGYIPICPHLNTFLMDGVVDDDVILEGDLEIIRRLRPDDAIYMMKGYANSTGATGELKEAREHGLEVMFE
jgi:hypothetical protein